MRDEIVTRGVFNLVAYGIEYLCVWILGECTKCSLISFLMTCIKYASSGTWNVIRGWIGMSCDIDVCMDLVMLVRMGLS